MKTLAVLIFLSSSCLADAGFNNTSGQGVTTSNISMNIKYQSCTVTIDGQGNSAHISLPDVPASSLDAKDKTAGDTPFSITVSGCVNGHTAYTGTPVMNASVYFETQNSVDVKTKMLVNMDTSNSKATNVELEVIDNNSKNPIQPGGTTGNTTLPVLVTGAASSARFDYTARYHALGTVTAGAVSSTLVFSINYS